MTRASKDQDILNILKEMESLQEQYPEELLSARRAAFLEQVTQSSLAKEEQPALQDQDLLTHLRSLGSVPAQYPSRLMAARRASFSRRIAWLNFISLCTIVWQAIKNRIPAPAFTSRKPSSRSIPASLLAAGMALAVFLGYIFYENQPALSPAPPIQSGTVHSSRILASDTREVSIVCKSGLEPPLCLAGEYKGENGLTFQRNGSARPAVAKDTMPLEGGLYKAAYINDGLYGPGASWISNSSNSWIKIDLGKATAINTVTFGRDRLGKLSGHHPGQFVISLALSDNVYANGNNNNDNTEYQAVYDSDHIGFSGRISGPETVIAHFKPQTARYIKITFENRGTAIDEVEAFMAQLPVASSAPGNTSRDKPPEDSSSAASPSLTAASLPVETATSLSTSTPVPSDTATPIPSATSIPTNTNVPTGTTIPTSTMVPTDTPTPIPSDTPLPPSTSTLIPSATTTPVPEGGISSSIE